MGTFIKIFRNQWAHNEKSSLYVLFAGVGQLPTCKQCYYTTTELLKPKHFKSFTVAKLDFTIHRLSNGRPNCGSQNTGMQPFMQQVQINIESTNLSEQTQPVLSLAGPDPFLGIARAEGALKKGLAPRD